MSHEHHEHRNQPDDGNTMNRRAKWVLVGFLAIAGYFLIAEHKAHLSAWLSAYGIWLLLLACPVLHLFMHGGHGGHGNHGGDDGQASGRQRKEQGK